MKIKKKRPGMTHFLKNKSEDFWREYLYAVAKHVTNANEVAVKIYVQRILASKWEVLQ